MNNNTHEENVIAELKSIHASIEKTRRWIVATIILAALIIGALLSPDVSIRDGIGGTLLFLAVIFILVIAMGSGISSIANWRYKRKYDRERIVLLSGRARSDNKVSESQ